MVEENRIQFGIVRYIKDIILSIILLNIRDYALDTTFPVTEKIILLLKT